MTWLSWLKNKVKRLRANRKGFSSVVGAIFMMLIMWVIASTFFVWTLSQNTLYNEAIRDKNQLEADRLSEYVTASNANYTVSGKGVTIDVVISNLGPLSVLFENLWVLDNTINSSGFNNSISLSSSPGSNLVLNGANNNAINVNVSGAGSGDSFSSWFITARGNVIPLSWYSSGSSNGAINVGNLTQIMGDFLPDYHSVQWAECTQQGGNYVVGPWNTGWIVPSADSFQLVWRINMTYYGNSSITIDQNTMLFFTPFSGQNPGGKAPPLCYAVYYDNNTGYMLPYPGHELTVTPSSTGFKATLYFGSPDSPGGTGGMPSGNIAGNMMSVTIIGKSPSTYAQSFPLFAVINRGPTITLSPASGNTGTSVTVVGTGFELSSTITIKFDGTVKATSPPTVTSGSDGSFSAAFTVPFSKSGSHTVTATDASSNSASTSFTVTPSITISPTSGPAGTIVTVSGQGFAASKKITITYDGAPQATSPTTVTSNSLGSFSATFTAPDSSIGVHMVSATDGTGTASATFTVVPSITINPTSGLNNTQITITVSGKGFAASSTITIKFDGTPQTTSPSTITTNGSGSFSSATFTVTPAPGAHTVSATDANGNSVTTPFTGT